MRSKTLGRQGEDSAAAFLQKRGYQILQRNFRNRWGEIDIIALDGATVCFVEVKLRASIEKGTGFEAVDKRKQKKLTRLALAFLQKKNFLGRLSRFDVVSLRQNADGTCHFNILKNAFEASEGYNY